MPLIQETDLKIYRGVRETHQSNLPLQSREKTALFSTWCYHRGEAGKRKGGKNHTKISGKNFKRRLWSERATKKCLSPLLATEQTNSSPGPSPVWPLVICSVFMTRISSLLKHLWPICQAGVRDTDTSGKQKGISWFTTSFALLWGQGWWAGCLSESS